MILALFVIGTFQARGVNYVEGSARCPLAGVGTRADTACTRIALDDDNSKVDVDRTAHKITWKNDKAYDHETLIGDVLVLGYKNEKSPIAVHVMIKKKGNKVDAKVHAHSVSHDKADKISLEPFEIVVNDKTVLTPEQAQKAVTDPSVAAKLANEFIEVQSPAPGDVTVGIGVGKAAKDVVRAQLVTQAKGKPLAEVMAHDDWEVKITALTSLVPKDVVRRDLFLFGVENQAVLAPLKTAGLGKGQTLTFGMKGGKGSIALDDKSEPFANAADSARAFLELSFLGAILAR